MLRLGIIHVYGKIAPLDWEQKNGLKYKIDLGSINISKYLNNIKVLYDQREIPNKDNIDSILQKAKRIFFLGFGFAEENLEVLNLKNNINANQKIYGTAKGLTKNEISKIKLYFDKTHKAGNPDLRIEDCDNLTLLRNYL